MNKQIIFSLMMLLCALPLQAEVTFRNKTGLELYFGSDTKGEELVRSGEEIKRDIVDLQHGFFLINKSSCFWSRRANISEAYVQECVQDGDCVDISITFNLKTLVLYKLDPSKPYYYLSSGYRVDFFLAKEEREDDASPGADGFGGDGMLMFPF
ncbi:hypothetical protein K2W90_01475 [Candidatus Babeliales bacterium]|nr:hypothetical protein [Candidatus Babeliales bacterium]